MLDTKAKIKLVDALLQCNTIQDQGIRETFIQGLPSIIRDNTSWHANPRVHTIRLVDTCLNYPDGISQLLENLYLYEGDSTPVRQVRQIWTQLSTSGLIDEEQQFDLDDLESPEGAVGLESPFYIERREDRRFNREILKSGTTMTIIGARQIGKTSLLMRGIQAARDKNFSIIFFEFQMVDTSQLQELDNFLHYLALNIADQVNVRPDIVESVWQIPLSPKDRLTRFLEDYILKNTNEPIVLAIDEADKLAESNFRREFFSLIRAWHSRRALDPLWKKINVAMAISTQPYLLIDDINQSPFNVSTPIRLKNFTVEQVEDLNMRHGHPLNEAELSEMMTLLGGLPYLVRKAFYALIDEEMTWSELTAIATQRSGPFDAHLRQYRKHLQDPKLVEAVKSILKTETSSDENAVNRLISAGLVKQRGSQYQFKCQLYDQYFRGIFL